MGNSMVQSQSEQARLFLERVSTKMENYLNDITLRQLVEEDPAGDPDYYRGLLSSIRRLHVFVEEGLDACSVVLKDESFRKAAAEKTLYWIYHTVIEEFFSPRSDLWSENSRAAYTGKNSISFSEHAPASLKKLMADLEGEFQEMREELEYYETDYKTKMLQAKRQENSL